MQFMLGPPHSPAVTVPDHICCCHFMPFLRRYINRAPFAGISQESISMNKDLSKEWQDLVWSLLLELVNRASKVCIMLCIMYCVSRLQIKGTATPYFCNQEMFLMAL